MQMGLFSSTNKIWHPKKCQKQKQELSLAKMCKSIELCANEKKNKKSISRTCQPIMQKFMKNIFIRSIKAMKHVHNTNIPFSECYE